MTIAPNATHLLGGTGGGSAAAADVVVSFAVEAGQPSDFGVCVRNFRDDFLFFYLGAIIYFARIYQYCRLRAVWCALPQPSLHLVVSMRVQLIGAACDPML